MRVRILEKTSKDARASMWYIVSNLISRGSGFIFTPIFTRILAPEEYGVYPMYLSVMGIFTVVTTLELSGNTVYKGIERFDGDYTASVFGLESFLLFFAFISYAIFGKAVNSITGLGWFLTTALLLQVYFNAVEGLYFAKKRYNGDYLPVTRINAISGILSPALALLFIRFGLGGEARIIAPLIISAIASAVIIPVIFKRGKTISREKWKYALRLSLPLLPNYLAATLTAQGDKLIVGRLIGKEALGKYSAAFSAGLAPSVVTSGIALALTPWIMRKLKERKFERIKDVEKAIVAIIGFFITAYLSVIPEVFSFFAPKEYSTALPVCYLVSVSVMLSLLYSISSAKLLFYEKSFLITRSALVAAAVAIISEYALSKREGLVGVAVGVLIAHLIAFALSAVSTRKICAECALNANNYLPSLMFIAFFATLSFLIRGSVFARILLFSAAAVLFIPRILKAKEAMH